MGKQLRNRILIILGVIAASIYFTFPLQERVNLGLDLKGGMHLILQVDLDEIADEDAKKDAVPRAIEILRNRIDSIGVGEPVIQRQGENEILVQLPGITDRDKALRMIGETAKLEFRLVERGLKLKEALEGNVPAGYVLEKTKDTNEPILLEAKAAMSGERIADARVDYDSQGFNQPFIRIYFDSEGSDQFGDLTKANIGRELAILLDGKVLSSPTIQSEIRGEGQITGQFSDAEAQFLALALRSGALPAPMRIEEERTIGPLLGKDSINAGVQATTIGGVLVFIFMLIYFLKAGIISDIALSINLLLIFGIMGFLNMMLPDAQLTLTLPGIAGIILTLGMAVDANILINERIREEINNGRPLQAAVNNGFSKALKAIVDSNTTTLIAAFMLFQFGSGPIKGFAVTLSVGLVASLFTALFVTRTIFNILLSLGWLKSLPMLNLFRNTKVNFVSKRFICFGISALLIGASVYGIMTKKDTAYGIDFVGGQIQEYQFQTPISTDELRSTLKDIGLESAVIQQFDQYPQNIIIRTAEDTYDQVREGFRNAFPDNKFEELRVEKVGPVVGKALRRSALLAMLFALGGILIYIGFRFKHFDFATAGVIALLHDVFITFGLLILLGREVDLLVITALLTIAGYSVNDTIIIYDRIRENLVNQRKMSLPDILNLSINQTLGRTILTTITTMIVVVTLFLKGGEILNTFALTLIIGFLAGTYSTIFIASPLVLAWENNKSKKGK